MGENITNMQQEGWYNANNPSTPNGSNFDNVASSSTINVVDGQTSGISLNKINNESSAGANITNNQQSG